MSSLSDIRVSVAICTYNRAHYLERCLSGLRNQRFNEKEVEIIVVDNGSSDSTLKVVERHWELTSISTKLICIDAHSLSLARNAALKESTAKVICFLDDDAIALPNWLAELVKVFDADNKGVIGAVGGKVDPLWEIPPGDLDSDVFRGMYSLSDYAPEEVVMTYPHTPTGVNFAIRREAANRAGLFSTQLGRKGNILLSGEESEFLERIRALGYKLYYTPNAVVHHCIPKERITQNWVLSRALWGGRSYAIMQTAGNVPRRRIVLTVCTSFLNFTRYAFLTYFWSRHRQKYLLNKVQMLKRYGYLVQIFKGLPRSLRQIDS